MLEATLRKSFPDFTLDLALQCEEGLTVLFGPSGAGKTLTLNCLAGLARPDGGRILLNGEILFDAQRGVHVAPRARHAAYVFQSDTLFPHMTVEENLLFPLTRFGVIERRRRSRTLMETFHIGHLGDRYPRHLSGGEKQRAAIARALATDPKILLLDEPSRGLDHSLRTDLYRVLSEVRAQYRIPVLLVTHDRDEAYRLGARLLIYHAGRIVQDDTAERVFSAPRDRNVARLLGYTNCFEGTITRLDPGAGASLVRAGDATLSLNYLPGRFLNDRVELCIPPHRVRLGSGENEMAGDFLSEARLPSSVRLTFRTTLGEIECEIPSEGYSTPPARVRLSLPREAIHVFEKGVSPST